MNQPLSKTAGAAAADAIVGQAADCCSFISMTAITTDPEQTPKHGLRSSSTIGDPPNEAGHIPVCVNVTKAVLPLKLFLTALVHHAIQVLLAAALCIPRAEAASSPSPLAAPEIASQHDLDVQNVPKDLAILVARHLHQNQLPLQARSRLLTAVLQGIIDPEDGTVAQKLVDWHEQQTPLQRAKYISRVLESYWTPTDYNAFFLASARIQLQRDAFPEVVQLLQEMRDPMHIEVKEQRESLLGLALLLQNKTSEAAITLERLQGFPNRRRLDHFNFAVSLVGHDRRLEGLALLDELAEMPSNSPADQAISDRANMALGWTWLRERQGGTARASFKRVSQTGPYSNLALLGLGWTELVPDGKLQKVSFKRTLSCTDIRTAPEGTRMMLFNSYQVCTSNNKKSNFRYFRSFAYEPGGTAKERYAKALLWWHELAIRDVSDPAVQEALLAVGYVHSRMGNVAEAINAYQEATSRYEAEIARLSRLEDKVWWAGAEFEALLNDEEHSGQFAELRSSRPYTRLVTDLGLIKQTEEELASTNLWISQQSPNSNRRLELIDYVRTELDQQTSALAYVRSVHAAELTRLVATKIADTRDRLEKYRAEAVLATARLYDKPVSRDQPEDGTFLK